MSQNLNKLLIKCLVENLIAIEFSDKSLVDEDFSINLIEQISFNLQDISNHDRNTLIHEFNSLSLLYEDTISSFVRKLPETLGL